MKIPTSYLLTVIAALVGVIATIGAWVYLRDYDRLATSIVTVTDNTAALQEGFAVLNQILANQDDDIGKIEIRVERLELGPQ